MNLQEFREKGDIYSNRKDTISIRHKLEEFVDERYWSLLSRFLHGMCAKSTYDSEIKEILHNDTAKFLHNELLRSILFNAHFSRIPPPGINIPRKQRKHQIKHEAPSTNNSSTENTKIKMFNTFSASDFHHIQSINQLSQRMSIITNEKVKSFDSKSVGIILSALKLFLKRILKSTYELKILENPTDAPTVLTVEQVLHAVKSDPILSDFISPFLFTKYSNQSFNDH